MLPIFKGTHIVASVARAAADPRPQVRVRALARGAREERALLAVAPTLGRFAG